MDKILTITKLSGSGFIVRVDDRECGFDSWAALSRYIGTHIQQALCSESVRGHICTLTIKMG